MNQSLLGSMQSNTLEYILKKIGDSNRYQTIILIIFLGQWLVSVFVIFGPLYFLSEPKFVCPGGIQCKNENEGCKHGGQLWEDQPHTMTIEFELYCDNRYLSSTASSLTFIGSVLGNFFFSFLAEKYGRRIIMIFAWGSTTLGVIGIASSFNSIMLLAFIFIAGFGIIPSNSLNLVILGEQLGNLYRQKATTILLMSWSIYEIVLSGIAYTIQDWRTIYGFFITIPSIIIFISNFYISESPKFLLTKKPQKLLENLNSIAHKNGKEKLNAEEVNTVINQYNQENEGNQVKQYNFWHLFKIKSLRYITIASCTSMVIAQLIYYSTQFSLDSIGSNTYLNAVTVAIGETIAYFISSQIITHLKRKTFTIIFMIIGNVLCLVSFLIKSKIFETILAAMIRTSNCLIFAILHVFVQELFATPVRSIGVGIQMGTGLIGSALAPFLTTFFKQHHMSILGGIGLIAIPFNFGNLLFKETKGLKLKDRIEEEDDYIEKEITNTEEQMKDNYVKQQDEIIHIGEFKDHILEQQYQENETDDSKSTKKNSDERLKINYTPSSGRNTDITDIPQNYNYNTKDTKDTFS